jgi:hypothetical protein
MVQQATWFTVYLRRVQWRVNVPASPVPESRLVEQNQMGIPPPLRTGLRKRGLKMCGWRYKKITGTSQCCGSENFFFGFGSTEIFFGFGYGFLRHIFWDKPFKVFFQWPTNIFWIPVQYRYYEEKCCNCENMCFFSFNSSICHALLLNNNVWIQIRIRIQIFFGFGFGSGKKFWIISDSDPQHWQKPARDGIFLWHTGTR